VFWAASSATVKFPDHNHARVNPNAICLSYSLWSCCPHLLSLRTFNGPVFCVNPLPVCPRSLRNFRAELQPCQFSHHNQPFPGPTPQLSKMGNNVLMRPVAEGARSGEHSLKSTIRRLAGVDPAAQSNWLNLSPNSRENRAILRIFETAKVSFRPPPNLIRTRTISKLVLTYVEHGVSLFFNGLARIWGGGVQTISELLSSVL